MDGGSAGPPTQTDIDSSSQSEENKLEGRTQRNHSLSQQQNQEVLDQTKGISEKVPCAHSISPASSLSAAPPQSSDCSRNQSELSPEPLEEPKDEPELDKEQDERVRLCPPLEKGITDLDPGSDPPPTSEKEPELKVNKLPEHERGQNLRTEDPVSDQEPLSPSQKLELPPVSLLTPPPLSTSCGSDVPPQGEPKLCGFLQKQAGPLRSWKQRWFTYVENKNQLFYYRTPQDVMPLGRVELSSATFSFPLNAERATFHIKTPERTFILKAANQELMLYWLQQLQVKRLQHRLSCSRDPPTNNNNNSTSSVEFLPPLSSPVGLVGEEAATTSPQRTLLSNMSIKHPLIELQNSVRSLMKRSTQDWSGFHVDVESPKTADVSADLCCHANRPPPSDTLTPPTLLPSANTARAASPLEVESQRMKSSRNLHREMQMLKEELKAQKDLVMVLHKALEAAQLEKRSCAEFLAMKDEQERLELLRHRERQVSELRQQLDTTRTKMDCMRTRHTHTEAQLRLAHGKLQDLREKNQAKQEVILKLTSQVSRCVLDACESQSSSVAPTELQQEIENLKDDIEAHKIQNKFLNSEIFQLTNLWRMSSVQEKALMMKCAQLEATNCQVESRYLGILQKLQEVKLLDNTQRAAVQEVIEEALKRDVKSVTVLSSQREYDQYGFKPVSNYEPEDMKLLSKIQALEIRSLHLLHQEGGQHPLLGRWAEYLAGRSDQDLSPSPELKHLIRGGVPPEYRPRVWRCVVHARTRTLRECHPQRYEQLCERSRASPHLASRQIELDLHRTLTTNRHFSSPCSPTLQQLRRILLAFSWQNPTIGYCQGLNRLAAVALLVLQSEEEAFWCLVAMVETILPQDYYTKNLVASQADQRVLKDLMADKVPRLSVHFESHNVDISLITLDWFLVLFVESLHTEILLQLWDAFLYEGTKVMFRYALALFKYKEEEFLKIQESVQIYQYLRFFTKTVSDSRKLSVIAFGDLNPFPRRLLRNRRALHRERLQRELLELQEEQEAFVTASVERKDKDVDTAASEDDEEL